MPMRIPGLPGMATGLDTDTLVKQMMQPYKMKVDRVKQDRDIIKWKQDMYRDMIKDVKGFQDKYMKAGSKDFILSSNTFAGYDVTNSDSTVATATGTVGAITGNYKIDVQNLAESAKLSSNGVLKKTDNTVAAMDTKLSELSGWTVGAASSDFTITCGGKDYKISVSDSDTVSGLIAKANSAMSPNVRACFSELTGKVTFETQQSGTSSSVQASGLSFMGIADGSATGVNAKVQITAPDGTVVPNITESSNSFTIDGVCFNINKVGTSEITVKPNSQATVDKIKDFIGDYNKLIEKINNKIEEKKQYKYAPLTDDQKKDMKEDEIKKWEDTAKTGLLKNDNELSTLVSSLRRAFFDGVSGTDVSLQKIGLDTSQDVSKRGQIFIDETKLKKALEENGDAVCNLFTKASSSSDKNTKYNESGVFQRMKDILYDNVGTFDSILLKKAGMENSFSDLKNQYTEKIQEKDKTIKSMQDSLTARENKYYQRFAALEKAMNNMNAQSNWLASQLGGGGN